MNTKLSPPPLSRAKHTLCKRRRLQPSQRWTAGRLVLSVWLSLGFFCMCWSTITQAAQPSASHNHSRQVPPPPQAPHRRTGPHNTDSPKVQTHVALKRSRQQNAARALTHVLGRFRKARQTLYLKTKTKKSRLKHKLAVFSSAAHKNWRRLLRALPQLRPLLSPNKLRYLHRMLEGFSDQDRNRYSDFPATLTQSVLREIFALHRERQRRQRTLSIVQRNRARLLRPITQPRERPAPTGALALPTLVFTEKDLARFRGAPSFGDHTRFLRRPVRGGRLSSRFGWRRDPFTKRARFHNGIDFSVPWGRPVFAAAAGVVLRSRRLGACGLGIQIRHTRGFLSTYCHLSQSWVRRGQRLRAGQYIGRVGSTGRSTGPHLHFALSREGYAVDPSLYLK